MARAYCFIDAEHVRQRLSEIGKLNDDDLHWENLRARELAQIALNGFGIAGVSGLPTWRDERIAIDRVFVYGAVPEGESAADNKVRGWLDRCDVEQDTHVRRGRLVGTPPRQKGVDVLLAVEALRYATNRIIDVALLIAGDGDFVPLVQALREQGVLVLVCSFKGKLSTELEREADRVGYLPNDADEWREPLRRRT